jgi:predicted nucleic acid-binding protein
VIVLDSSFLIAFHNERDSQHEAARDLMREFLAGRWGKGLLPEYVFLEVVTVLLVRRDLATAVRTGRLLLEAQELDFVPCSDVFLDSVQLFGWQKNTSLSFADAAIAVIARTLADGQVLTFDAGFRKVTGLRPEPAK